MIVSIILKKHHNYVENYHVIYGDLNLKSFADIINYLINKIYLLLNKLIIQHLFLKD